MLGAAAAPGLWHTGLASSSCNPSPVSLGTSNATSPSTRLPLGTGGCAVPRLPFPENMVGTSPGPRSPALPSGAAHAPSGLAAGSPGAAGHSPSPVPIEQGPHATSPKRPADSPNNSTADKNHKATSALPRAVPHRGCPSWSAQPGAVGWMGVGGEPSWGVQGARSLPGPGLCVSAPPAGPPRRMTPIKRSSSCLVDNKTLFFFLFYNWFTA